MKTPLYIVAVICSVFVGCSTPQIASMWTNTPVIVNGHDDEWSGALMYQEKEKVGVGVKNDGANLYIAIKTLDEPTRQKIIRTGMTVWLDSTDGTKKNFGIHFPLGLAELWRGGNSGGASSTPTRNPDGTYSDNGPNTSQMRERLAETLRDVEIIGPSALDKKRVPVMTSYSTNGIKVAISDSLDALIYELVVPLKATQATPLAIGTDVGKTISIGIETADMKEARRANNNSNEGGMGGAGMPSGTRPGGMGGFGGGGGMHGGRGGGGSRGSSDGSSEPLSMWFDVPLATQSGK